MQIEVQTAQESRSLRNRRIAAAALAVLAVAAGAGVLARSAKSYIDRTVAEAVASVLTNARIDDRARMVALDVIKTSPSVVAESLNQYIVQQQQAVLTKEEDGYRALVPEMVDATGVPAMGHPDAKVTVVYFFDANCPYCKQMDPILRPLLMAGSNVRVVYREIPILGPASDRAARFASAVWKVDSEHYDLFHSALMNNKGQIDDATIDRIAITTLGEETAQKVALAVARDDDGAVSGPVKRNLDLARKAGIKGTPFFSIGGKTFFKGAVSREEFAEAVMKALAGEP
jgi:protein-disulfide isomerase